MMSKAVTSFILFFAKLCKNFYWFKFWRIKGDDGKDGDGNGEGYRKMEERHYGLVWNDGTMAGIRV